MSLDAVRDETAMKDQRLGLLVIGTLPPLIGGTSVSLQHLIDYLRRRDDVALTVVDTGGIRGHLITGPLRFAATLWRIVRGVNRSDVITLHLAMTAIPILGPIVWVLSRVWGRPLILRKFGGDDYSSFGPIRRAITRWVAHHCDLYLVQTQILIRAAHADGIRRVAWYPTSRPMDPDPVPVASGARACRRFVFLGHVKTQKGIREIIDAAERFGEEVSVDVYGPFFGELSEATFSGLKRARYRGVVPPGKAIPVLRQYDALLLPTYWLGEGYPGIIPEAYSAGLPVITTRWLAIPEIVDDSSGILLEPRDAEGLHQAMRRLIEDDAFYGRLCEGARAKRALLDTQVWSDRLVEMSRALCCSD